jgi:hypothetical protein
MSLQTRTSAVLPILSSSSRFEVLAEAASLAVPPAEAKATRHRVALPQMLNRLERQEPADTSLRLRTPAACKQRISCYRQSGNTGIGRIAYLAGWVRGTGA